ncbi:hypothetical protein [Streptomonospora nanhaiensis]|uniref:hypothetical protein n=1 Tax=Streptomonospora nanhaiensis TaxID=1323731 RepID=UPI001C38E997|nr:hypothetical protein [Streptomonospora nanhaiensis]MBV2362753.1 hypothetical protein [Streptomonospora nanhaiensis]
MADHSTDPDWPRLQESLAEARELPPGPERDLAVERATRAYARKGVVRLGVLFGLFGIPWVLVLLEARGMLPQQVRGGGLYGVGASLGGVFIGILAWIEGARQFLRMKDRREDRRIARAAAETERTASAAEAADAAAASQHSDRNATAAARAESAVRRPAGESTATPAASADPPSRPVPETPRPITAAVRTGRVDLVKHRRPKSGQPSDPRLPLSEHRRSGRRAERDGSPARRPGP